MFRKINIIKINFKKRNWTAKDFLDRWFLQSNYPLLTISFDYVQDKQVLKVTQERNINMQNSIFDNVSKSKGR
jgi:aminopeptidase N